MDNVVTIKLDLPDPGACMTANIDEGNMYVEIKRADTGYTIEVLGHNNCSVGCLIIQDTVLAVLGR